MNEIAQILPRLFDPPVGAAGLAPRAVSIAGQLDHPVHDCLYLALAELERTVLVTADMRLLGKVHSTAWEARVVDFRRYGPGSLRG